MMKEIKFKKIKLSKKYLIKDDMYCKQSYALPVSQYIAISLKGMKLSKYLNQRKTETRYALSKIVNKRKFVANGNISKLKNENYELTSYYKGEIKNGKADGWGIEVLISPPVRIYQDHTVVQYYEGEWKKGKRNGYGECYDYHPLLGPTEQWKAEDQIDKIYICQDDDNDIYSGNSYKGIWKDGIIKR